MQQLFGHDLLRTGGQTLQRPGRPWMPEKPPGLATGPCRALLARPWRNGRSRHQSYQQTYVVLGKAPTAAHHGPHPGGTHATAHHTRLMGGWWQGLDRRR